MHPAASLCNGIIANHQFLYFQVQMLSVYANKNREAASTLINYCLSLWWISFLRRSRLGGVRRCGHDLTMRVSDTDREFPHFLHNCD